MDRTKFSKKHILVATLGFFVGFFMGLGVNFPYSLIMFFGFLLGFEGLWYQESLGVAIVFLIIILLALMIFLILSSIFFGWLFNRKQQNKFRLACGTTFGSFIATSLCFLLVMSSMGELDHLDDFIFPIMNIILTVLISVALIILPVIPDRFARRS